jgi:DNA-binding SARP family transcriptional activator
MTNATESTPTPQLASLYEQARQSPDAFQEVLLNVVNHNVSRAVDQAKLQMQRLYAFEMLDSAFTAF